MEWTLHHNNNQQLWSSLLRYGLRSVSEADAQTPWTAYASTLVRRHYKCYNFLFHKPCYFQIPLTQARGSITSATKYMQPTKQTALYLIPSGFTFQLLLLTWIWSFMSPTWFLGQVPLHMCMLYFLSHLHVVLSMNTNRSYGNKNKLFITDSSALKQCRNIKRVRCYTERRLIQCLNCATIS